MQFAISTYVLNAKDIFNDLFTLNFVGEVILLSSAVYVDTQARKKIA